MGSVFNCGDSGANARLRREDCEFVKHDKLFSNWKILVCPSDGREGQGAGRNGIGRYPVRNVPIMEFGPGVFELGVTAPSWSPGPHESNQRALPLKRDDVIPVYVGQAASIRQRLQRFAQAGAHLEPSLSGYSLRELHSGGREVKHSDGHGPRLFSEVFALGSSIAFRWAHTDSRVVAEKVQAELLAVFDYAWNKGTNGNRRSHDILAKLSKTWPTKEYFSNSWNPIYFSNRSHLRSRNNAVGIKVALRKPQDSPPSKSDRSPKSPKRVRRTLGLNLCSLVTIQPQVSETGSAKPARASTPIQQKRVNTPGRDPKKTAIPGTKLDHISLTSGANFGWCLGLQSCFPTRNRRLLCKEAENNGKQERPSSIVEKRRPGSLSFNTWVKIETEDLHVRNNGGGTKAGFSVNINQEKVQPRLTSGIDAQRRSRKMSFMYAPMPVDDSRRG